MLTTLVNEISRCPDKFILVLDDYHWIDSKSIDTALSFLLMNLPPQLHLVIATREDPNLPLARLRVQGQLTELRLTDLRFTSLETTTFLNQAMGLNLAETEVTSLAIRTEGWIAGLQLAAISMQGQKDTTSFIQSFTDSHYFVLDYLVEEVLQHQPEDIQTFLLHTSILDRLCGQLCDVLLPDSSVAGQATLEYLERSNLFIVPLDNERKWYRYHHLFAELLRQRLQQSVKSSKEQNSLITALHLRASSWLEENNLMLEAFHHATSANDFDHAEQLLEERKLPTHLRSTITTVVNWLESLSTKILEARPSLWVQYASLLLVSGLTTGVEEKLQAAEALLVNAQLDDRNRNLLGQIASARATLALTKYEFETVILQSHRALEYLHPTNLPSRFFAVWTLACAYFLQGNRAEGGRACAEALAISQKTGDVFSIMLASSALGQVQEAENQLYQAAATY